MNFLLWVLQVCLAWLCIAGGAFQIFKIDELQTTVAAMRALPHGLWAFLGAFSCLGGFFMIAPAAIKGLRKAVPMAAAAVAAESALVTAFYVHYGDSAPMPYSIVMTILGAFIAYGRFSLKPL
jgi:hypothetical protein